MKKFMLLAALLCLIIFRGHAQAVQWAQIQDICPPNVIMEPASPQITSDGTDLISLGRIINSIALGNQTFTTPSNTGSSYLAKHDQAGNLLWAQHLVGTYFGTMYDYLNVTTDVNKNIYVAGHYDRTLIIDTLIFNNSSSNPFGYGIFFIAKFSPTGSLLWARNGNSGAFSNSFSYNITLTTDGQGDVYTAGTYRNSFSISSATINPVRFENVFLLKYDANGKFQWLNNIDTGGPLTPRASIISGPNNNVYVSSISRKNTTAQAGLNCYSLRKFNNAGQEQWSKFVPIRLNNYQPFISIDASENVYLSAGLDTTLTFDNHVLSYTYGFPNNNFVAKISPAGKWKWAKQIPTGPFSNSYFYMESKLHNELTIIKYFLYMATGSSIHLLKLDTAGTVIKKTVFNDNFQPNANGTGSYFGIRNSATTNSGDTYIAGGLYGNVTLGSFLLTAPPGIVNTGPFNPSASFIGKVLANANIVNGTLFIDANANGLNDPGEKNFENGLVEITPGPYHTNSLFNGTYSAYLLSGNFNLKVLQPTSHYTFSPQNHIVSFAGNGQSQTKDFALIPIPERNDVKISVTNIAAARPGFQVKYRVSFENVGTTTLSDTITLKYDPNYLTYLNSSVTHASHQPGKILWTYSFLNPTEKRNIDLEFSVSSSTPLGTALNSRAVAGPLASDFIIENNYDTLSHLVTGSYDPNDKQVSADGQLSLAQIKQGNFLNYTIRFQNTGSDTAFTVIVRDSISSKLLMASFELLSASHPYTFRLLDNGMAEWRFNNIMLPDSNQNEQGSHGFIRYRIKPETNLRSGDIIKSRAAIYFDYNAPIFTNNAVTRIRKTKDQVNTLDFDLYPNPARNYVTVAADLKKPTAATIRLVNILGQTISEVALPANNQLHYQLPLNNLAKGVYIVQLGTANGRQSQRLVVQ